MAAALAVSWSVLLPTFWLLSQAAVTANSTSYDFNTTVFPDQSGTYNVTDNYTTTDYTPYEERTTQSSGTTEASVPSPPAEPLPVSGRLPSPVTDVVSLCPCNQHQDECDVNCCCDRECGEEVALFTGCSVHSVSGSEQLCSRDVASYSLSTTVDGYSELQSPVQKETNYDVFCIQSQNRVDGLAHPSPALPTDSNFERLFEQFNSFVLGSEEDDAQVPAAQPQASSGYQYGDVIQTTSDSGWRGTFSLPASAVTAECVDNNAAAFLMEQSSRCFRSVDLQRDCGHLPPLSMVSYTKIQLLAGKNKDAVVVPVEVTSVVLQSLDRTWTELELSGGEDLHPVLVNTSVCANVVMKVGYVITYTSAGEIRSVSLSLVLGFVQAALLPLEQTFHVKFVQEAVPQVAVGSSGNPGYVVGLPLVSGQRTADGIARSIDPRNTLSLLHGGEQQDCLQGSYPRSPVLFGLDSASGCTLRLEETSNCSLISQVLLDVLRGRNSPRYVASFGNSPLDNPLDWVAIKSSFSPGETQSCSIPMSLHLEIEWTKYGTQVNPQAQIVSVREVIQTDSSILAQLSGGPSFLPITKSVAFIPVSAAALPGYRATPTINVKLPFDFFFPFE